VGRELEPGSDLHATREYRLHVVKALTRRALARALARCSRSSKEAPGER